jgi:hypothetical protein
MIYTRVTNGLVPESCSRLREHRRVAMHILRRPITPQAMRLTLLFPSRHRRQVYVEVICREHAW